MFLFSNEVLKYGVELKIAKDCKKNYWQIMSYFSETILNNYKYIRPLNHNK